MFRIVSLCFDTMFRFVSLCFATTSIGPLWHACHASYCDAMRRFGVSARSDSSISFLLGLLQTKHFIIFSYFLALRRLKSVSRPTRARGLKPGPATVRCPDLSSSIVPERLAMSRFKTCVVASRNQRDLELPRKAVKWPVGACSLRKGYSWGKSNL